MKNMSKSAISAKSAKQIFANFVKCVKSIFGTTRRSEGRVTEAEYPMNYQRISNLSLTIRSFRVAILAVLLLFVGSWNSEVWGNDCNYTGLSSTQYGTKNGDTYWAFGTRNYYDVPTFEFGSVSNEYGITKVTLVMEFPDLSGISAVTEKFQAQYKIGNGGWNNLGSSFTVGNDKVTKSFTPSIAEGSTVTFRLQRVEKARFTDSQKFTISATIKMAKTLSGSEEEMTFDSQTYNTTSTAQTRTFTFSNEETGKSISISENTNSTEFPATFSKSGDCTGSVTVSVKFKPSAQGTRSGSITVSGDCGSKTFEVSGTGVRATSSLEMNDGEVNVSIAGINASSINLDDLIGEKIGNGGVSYTVTSGNASFATISGSTFSATKCGDYTVQATQAQTDQYTSTTDEFTITVNKLQPTFEWWNADGKTHIYASDVLKNVAQAKYNENDVDGLSYSYSSNSAIVVVDGTSLRVQNTFVGEQKVKISVSTEETNYYKAGSDSHTYLIEPKATPEFWLNDTINLPDDPVQELNLFIGETATMRFVNTDESNNRFTYPTNPTYVSYEHNSDAHTGVITGTVAGDEYIQFHQGGTNTIFDHLRKIHVHVNKHPVNLTTTLDGGTWKVDSIYDDAVYSIVTPTGSQPALSKVTVTSSNDAVLKKVDGHWKAVGEGEATLTISHPSTNDYWAGQTVEAHITVVKHTPVITWNLDASYPWGAIIEDPVSSSNEELPFTVESDNPEIANYVNGRIEVYNKVGSATFTLTQAGNYKWNAAASNLTKTISVYKPNNHLPANLSTANYSDFRKTSSGTVVWDNNCFKLGDGGVNEDEVEVIIHFTGVPKQLSFDQQLDKIMASLPGWPDCRVYQSADGKNWGEPIWYQSEREEFHNGVKLNLKPSTQYIKFEYNGSIYCRYKNIKITERREIAATPASLTFATADVDASAQTLPVQIDWYNVKTCTATIEGANAGFFQLAETEPIAASLDHYGTETLHVTYAYPQAGTHTATLKVESEDGYKVEVPLSATSLKVTPAITWKENLSPMQRGIDVADPATSPVDLTYSSSDETVVAVEGNVLKPLKKGEATITASFDGTSDLKWNSASSTIDVVVTDMKVQHINWTQTFTRLKYTTDPVLSSKNTQPFALEATVSYYDADAAEEVILDRKITFTSGDESVVKVIEGMLHVIGLGETTLTAHVEGIADSLFEATVIRTVKVREPSTDCEAWVLENKSGSINTISSKEFTLTGEGDSIYFEAWREPIKVVIEYTDGDLYLAEVYENGSENTIWHNKTQKNTPTSYKCAISREAKKVKFYTVVGATGYHNFSDVYVRRARYVELENTKGKTTHSVHFSTADAKPGVAKTKSFTVNYSNITDQLEMELKGGESSKFSVVSPASKTIGTDCGEYGTASVQVQFLSNEVESYKDTLVIHNLNQSVEVYLSAEVDKHHQQITWNPATTELKTTDAVTFDATTSAAAAGLSVRYEVVEGDAATVNAETGALTIIKDGNVTIKATAEGNDSYHDAEPVSKTFTISKVTPTIATVPTAATMTMPNTSLADCELTGGEASVAGSFAWADNTINAIFNNTGYTVIFTPENTNWYSSVSCVVVVPVNKMIQTITWDFAELEMYPNAQVIFDASTNAGLPVSYSSSDETVAYVDGENRLRIIRGGEVTITAKQGGNETYAAAEPVSKTLTINRFAPEIVTLPNASSMKIGRVLSDASLSGGRAELNGEKVEGSFAWVDGNTTVMNVAGTFSKEIVFNPSNANLYEPVYGSMQDVSVEKYAPVITQNLHGSAITYGDALSASILSGSLTATDYIKIPSEEVDGSYGWLQPSALLNAGTQNAIVRFTPANMDWYEAVDFPVQLTVNRASTDGLTVTGVSEILYGQILGEAVPENTTANPVHGGIVAGEMNWDASLDMEEYKEIGTYPLPVTLVVNDPNYIPATLNGTAVLTVKSGFAFKGNNGTAWNDEGNWFGQEGLPGENDPVLIMSDVVVSTNVTVDAMSIRQGVKVTVTDGGSLTIKNGDAVQRNAYGNLIVESGGEMEVKNGIMHVQDFTLKAKLGDGATPGKSGQVHNPASLEVNGNAYFDLALDPSGQCSQGWYDFTVPFPVDAVNGVSRFKNDTEVNIRCEVNYAIMDFSESRRIETGYGWKKYHGVMQPGQCYSITIDDYDNIYRFKKTATGSFNNQLTEVLAYTDTDSDVRGWNGLGNGTMAYANLNAAGIEKVQLYNHTSNSYTAVPLSEYTYVVGSAYFVQAPFAAAEISYTHNGENHTLRAPQRTAEEVSEFALTLRDNKSAVADRLYISANEEASDGYEIGRELTKFGTPTESKVAQVWANAYDGMKLCDIEMLLENQNAVCELGIYAPQDGNYTLSVDEAPSNGILYLTYNGYAIWNLSYSPYSFELTKGSTEGYGLKLYVNAVATDIESIQGEGEQCRKIMIDNQIYIVMPNGTMYDITGKKVQ